MYKDSYLYKNYFAKDKPFRHIWQHFLVATAAYFTIINILPITLASKSFLLFLLFTYIPDLDGLIYVLRHRKNTEIKKIVSLLGKLQILNALHIASKIHKKFTGLIIHNIYGLWGITIIMGAAIYTKNYLAIMCATAVLAHFLFDIFDDIYQMGHIRNWLR